MVECKNCQDLVHQIEVAIGFLKDLASRDDTATAKQILLDAIAKPPEEIE